MIRQLTITDTEGNVSRFHFADILTSRMTLVIAGFLALTEREREESGYDKLHWSDLTDEYTFRTRLQSLPHKDSTALPDPHPLVS